MKFLLAALLIFGLILLIETPQPVISNLKSEAIQIHVKGEVRSEGIYELPNHSTIGDLLKIVELSATADTDVLNNAQILFHNDVLIIPARTETGRVSLNTATIEQLITLPGIGEKTAQAIIAYREDNGLFQSLDEIMNVKGIGPAKFAKISELICL